MIEGDPISQAEQSEDRPDPGVEPRVPLPADFPRDAKVVPIPSMTIEEQRRELEEEMGEASLKNRHGGGLSDSTQIA